MPWHTDNPKKIDKATCMSHNEKTTLGFHQLQISVEKSNIASIKITKKNGGVYERSFPHEGEGADIYMIRWGKKIQG